MSVRVFTTVLEAAASYDLVSLEDYKTDMDITDTSTDAFLQRAISKASAYAAVACNRVFPAETVKDEFSLTFVRLQSTGETSLQLTRFPVVSITSVLEGDTELVEDTDFKVETESGQLLRIDGSGQVRDWRAAAIAVTYVGGFSPIPLDLQDAATTVVKSLQFNRTRDPLLRSENILSGLYAYTLFDPSDVPGGTAEQVSSTLERYRVPVFG